MKSWVLMNFATLITFITTIIGFIITYKLTKRNLKNEVVKQKISIGLEKMVDAPFKILSLLDQIQKDTLDTKYYANILYQIYAYGSKTAILIASTMQRLNYEIAEEEKAASNEITKSNSNLKQHRVLTLLSLLISQIKYDLTGEIINPEFWFIMKITDYNTSEMRESIRCLINEDVFNLGLNKEFLIN